MHPFGRASPSVINRLIKAGSLLSPTCSSRDIRAIPSVSQAATPMKPRANLGNRTRQPKGCANRIAKPARQCRTSQNHLMMIILNKTGATTVAQLDFETLSIHTQSETRGCRRHVLCANFSKPAHYFCYCPTGPSRGAGREAPPRGCLLYGATLVRLCDCVLACRVVSRGHVPLYAIVAVHVVATSCPGRRARRGRDVAAWFFVAVMWLRHADEC